MGRQDDHRSHPIIAHFSRFGDREAVTRNVTKLRGTRIFINEDLCPASQSIRKAQLPQLKQARSEGKVAYFRHTRLIVKERPSGTGTSGFTRGTEASTTSGLQVGSTEEGAGSSDVVMSTEVSTVVEPVLVLLHQLMFVWTSLLLVPGQVGHLHPLVAVHQP